MNGSATQTTCNCYTVTPAINSQSGSVWNANKINLATSFDFWFRINLGCNDATGADGMVFILQPVSTSIGSNAEGMGFSGVSPSVGIPLDTWQNLNRNDPPFDHIGIQLNGQVTHSNDLAPPVPISASSDNVEDCQWHNLRITWDAGAKWLRAYFDGSLRVQAQLDLVASVFNGDPMVYWGFTGATGGQSNLQRFCTALEPQFSVGTSSNTVCEDSAVAFTNTSFSFAPIVSYNWSFGDGTTSTAATPPPHVYATSGTYNVNLKIKGLDGCERDSTVSVVAVSPPVAMLSVGDTCAGFEPRIQFAINNTPVQYTWQLNGTQTAAQPSLQNLSAGMHSLQLTATSNFNCGAPAVVTVPFSIRPKPVVAAVVQDGCVEDLLTFTGSQLDAATTVTRWRWSLGDNAFAATQTVQHRYAARGSYNISLYATADNGCASDTVKKTVTANAAYAFAGRDTVVVRGRPAQLQGAGNGAFSWSPSANVINGTTATPTVTLNADETFVLTVTTPEGCVASDEVVVKVFNGPAVYVPTGFTPNGDGKNDVLRPVYVGIKTIGGFSVFNRWGQRLFYTTESGTGWNPGNAPTGVYVWTVQATTDAGQLLTLKGTVTLIR